MIVAIIITAIVSSSVGYVIGREITEGRMLDDAIRACKRCRNRRVETDKKWHTEFDQ